MNASVGGWPRWGVPLLLGAISILAALTAIGASTAAEKSKLVKSLEPGAQASISKLLGRLNKKYYAAREDIAGNFRIQNQAHSLAVRFDEQGFHVQNAGKPAFGMILRAVGFGEDLTPVAPTTPKISANRVAYLRPGLTEWYLNGPAGMEQGFTLSAPPAGDRSLGRLTIAMTLSGNEQAILDEDRRGIRFPSGVRYAGLSAFDAVGRSLPVHLELDDRDLRIVTDVRDAKYPITIDPFVQTAKLWNFEGSDDQNLGFQTVAVWGDILAVGASGCSFGAGPQEDMFGRGCVFLFRRPEGGWTVPVEPVAELRMTDAQHSLNFGSTVAMLGDTIVVAAPADHATHIVCGVEGCIEQPNPNGRAYLYKKPIGGWSGLIYETAKLIDSEPEMNQSFAENIAIAGNLVVLSAYQRDFRGEILEPPYERQGIGAVYVFQEPTTGWNGVVNEIATLRAADGDIGHFFGAGLAVSADGNTIAAGSPFHDDWKGAIYIFEKPASGWTSASITPTLVLPDGQGGEVIGDAFGAGLAISGNLLAASAVNESRHNAGEGAVYLYQKPAGGWQDAIPDARLSASDGTVYTNLGRNIRIEMDRIVVGAETHTTTLNSNFNQGAVYVFDRPASGWYGELTESYQIASTESTSFSSFGYGLAVQGGVVYVGAPVQRDLDPEDPTRYEGAIFIFEDPNSAAFSATVGNPQVRSRQRLNRVTDRLEIEITVTNQSQVSHGNVSASVAISSPGVTLDPESNVISCGALGPAETKTCADTLILDWDRRYPLDLADLQFEFLQ